MRLIFPFLIFVSFSAVANDTTRLLYNPKANADADVKAILVKAKEEKKHVLLQIGGNWCVLCYRFNSFLLLDSTLKNLLHSNYVVYHLNYSPENKNANYLKKLGHPEKYGFPALVVLDENGKMLHSQIGGMLQKGNGYDFDKVKNFLLEWAPQAMNETYSKKEVHQ